MSRDNRPEEKPLLPAMLRGMEPFALFGAGSMSGVALEPLFWLDHRHEFDRNQAKRFSSLRESENEIKKWLYAKTDLLLSYEKAATSLSGGDRDQKIVATSILHEKSFNKAVTDFIKNENFNAASAVMHAYYQLKGNDAFHKNSTLSEKQANLFEVCSELMTILDPAMNDSEVQPLKRASVVCAKNLSVAQFLAIDKKNMAALVLTKGSLSSHLAIIVKSYSIPMLIGVEGLEEFIKQQKDQRILVDSNRGFVIATVHDRVAFYYNHVQQVCAPLQKDDEDVSEVTTPIPAANRLKVSLSLDLTEDTVHILRKEAGAVGLLRTEFLYMNPHHLPSEEQQFQLYRAVVQGAVGGEVVLRTVDLGDDKPLSSLGHADKGHPFYGLRGARCYPAIQQIITTQLRAIARAARYGKVALLVPMVTDLAQIRWMHERFAEVVSSLREEGLAYNPNLKIGVMVEVPSLAYSIGQLASAVDFFSIGSNDLAAHFFAAPRDNHQFAQLAPFFHPAFLNFLSFIIQAIHHYGKTVTICGEMASDRSLLPLLVGLKVDGIAVTSSKFSETRSNLKNLNESACYEIIQKSLLQATAAEVLALLS